MGAFECAVSGSSAFSSPLVRLTTCMEDRSQALNTQSQWGCEEEEGNRRVREGHPDSFLCTNNGFLSKLNYKNVHMQRTVVFRSLHVDVTTQGTTEWDQGCHFSDFTPF